MKINSINSIAFKANHQNTQPKRSYTGTILGSIAGVGVASAYVLNAAKTSSSQKYPGFVGGFLGGLIIIAGSTYDNLKYVKQLAKKTNNKS